MNQVEFLSLKECRELHKQGIPHQGFFYVCDYPSVPMWRIVPEHSVPKCIKHFDLTPAYKKQQA